MNCLLQGAKLTFLVFRQRVITVQGVLQATEKDGDVSESMVRWVEKLPRESVVLVEGKVRKAQQEVKATDFHEIEIDVQKVRSSIFNQIYQFTVRSIVVPDIRGSQQSSMDCSGCVQTRGRKYVHLSCQYPDCIHI